MAKASRSWGRRLLVVGLCCIASSSLPAQEMGSGKEAEEPRPLLLKIVCTESGKKVPRRPDAKPGEGPQPFRLVGHAFVCELGEQRFETLVALEKGMKRVRADPRCWIDDPWNPGTRVPPVMEVQTGDGVLVQDVLQVLERVWAAGILVIEPFPQEGRTSYFVPKELPADHKTIDPVLPFTAYCEPDEQPQEGRVEITVYQDGRMRVAGAVVYDPSKPRDELRSLRKQLLLWKSEAIREGRTYTEKVYGIPHEKVAVPILICADKWTPWRHVCVLVKQCMDPQVMFWKIEIAVHKKDVEQQLGKPPADPR